MRGGWRPLSLTHSLTELILPLIPPYEGGTSIYGKRAFKRGSS